MKPIAITGLVLLTSMLHAQQSLYEVLPLGDYAVGYCDTLLHNPEVHYVQYGYDGPAPMFVQVWYPLTEPSDADYLSYGAMRTRAVPEELVTVYDALTEGMDWACIQYNVAESFETFEPIDYSPHTPQDVLEAVKGTPTKSKRHPLSSPTNFPVIVYHHGAQGLSDENYLMAEYFASRGFLFVTSNYHLPFEGQAYGSSSDTWDWTSFPKALTSFARTLTTDDQLFYIGHSWGAQVGLTFLQEGGWADGFVSMETTIEWKTDSAEIEQKWPEVYRVVHRERAYYDLPVLLIANTMQDQAFPFFSTLRGRQVIHASSKEEFGHESYTTAFLLRTLHNAAYPQPDSTLMREQLRLYGEHMELIEAFIQATRQSTPIPTESFRERFYLH